MNSGPLTGSDIELEALQPGSSIMPGKVNPVTTEAAGNGLCGCYGKRFNNFYCHKVKFQLNVMLPVIAYNLLKSINLMGNCMPLLAKNVLKHLKLMNKIICRTFIEIRFGYRS